MGLSIHIMEHYTAVKKNEKALYRLIPETNCYYIKKQGAK